MRTIVLCFNESRRVISSFNTLVVYFPNFLFTLTTNICFDVMRCFKEKEREYESIKFTKFARKLCHLNCYSTSCHFLWRENVKTPGFESPKLLVVGINLKVVVKVRYSNDERSIHIFLTSDTQNNFCTVFFFSTKLMTRLKLKFKISPSLQPDVRDLW